jgi:hypothetical protein
MATQAGEGALTGELGRWWSPAQWLRLVYGVWADQLWYWWTVRPRLKGRRQGWGLLVQALLGALCTAGILLLVSVPALRAAGVAIDGRSLALSLALCAALLVAGAAVAALLAGTSRAMPGLAAGGPFLAGVGLYAGIWLHLGPLNGVMSQLRTAGVTTVALLAGCALMGMYWGLIRCVMDGDVLWVEILGEAVVFGLGIVERSLAVAVGAAALWALCAFLGMRWAARQVPDEELQKQLAAPPPPPDLSKLLSGLRPGRS